LVRTLLCALFPLLFFFNFLYYTDVGGVFFSLLAYYAALRGWTAVAVLPAALAVLYRQTNAVWVAFVAATVAVEALQPPPHPSKVLAVAVAHDLAAALRACWSRRGAELARALAPLALLIGAFGAFVGWNGGVVVGDRSNHSPVCHAPRRQGFEWGWSVACPGPLTAFVPRGGRFSNQNLPRPARDLPAG
jgi:alpha-1,2-glucosyltransferase